MKHAKYLNPVHVYASPESFQSEGNVVRLMDCNEHLYYDLRLAESQFQTI